MFFTEGTHGEQLNAQDMLNSLPDQAFLFPFAIHDPRLLCSGLLSH